MRPFLSRDDIRDLCEQRRHGHAERDAQTRQQRGQQGHLVDAGVGDGAEGDEEGDCEEEAEGCREAGAALVGPVAD